MKNVLIVLLVGFLIAFAHCKSTSKAKVVEKAAKAENNENDETQPQQDEKDLDNDDDDDNNHDEEEESDAKKAAAKGKAKGKKKETKKEEGKKKGGILDLDMMCSDEEQKCELCLRIKAFSDRCLGIAFKDEGGEDEKDKNLKGKEKDEKDKAVKIYLTKGDKEKWKKEYKFSEKDLTVDNKYIRLKVTKIKFGKEMGCCISGKIKVKLINNIDVSEKCKYVKVQKDKANRRQLDDIPLRIKYGEWLSRRNEF